MEPVQINVSAASIEELRAECERLLISGVTTRTRVGTLRTKLRAHQQNYQLYLRWEYLVRLLVGEQGLADRPRPMTLVTIIEWAHDILYAQLEAEDYVPGAGTAKAFRDYATGDTVVITGRQGVRNVNVVVLDAGGASGPSGSISILHAATCTSESIRLIVEQWEQWKAGNRGPR